MRAEAPLGKVATRGSPSFWTVARGCHNIPPLFRSASVAALVRRGSGAVRGSRYRHFSGPLRRGQELILPVAIIASVLVILVPLPPALMDVLLAANITVAVIMSADDDLRPHAAGVQHLSLAAAGHRRWLGWC